MEPRSFTSLQPSSQTTATEVEVSWFPGGISMTVRTRLRLCQGTVTGLYHRDIVIEPVAVPSARRHGKVVIFLDTNARDHCTRVVQDHLHFGRITTLPWPVKSPDLSPVVYLWDILGRRVRKRPHKPQDIKELANALLEE